MSESWPTRRRFLAGTAAAVAGGIAYEKFRDYYADEFLNLPDDKFLELICQTMSEETLSQKKLKSRVNAPRNPDTKFSKEEIEDLIWNMVNEAGPKEPEEGRLGIMLCVLDRILHKDNPATATGVIYKNWQFSWVDHGRAFPIPKKPTSLEAEKERQKKLIESKKYTELVLEMRNFIKKITGDGKLTVGEIKKKIVKEIEEKTGIIVPFTPVLFYKRYDWDHNDPKKRKRMSKRTVRMFKQIEAKMKRRGQVPFRLGSHNFYTAWDFNFV
jgi:hypothetical protein